MKAEFLSEAMSFLDDDIIEEADALRRKSKNYKSIWIKCLSAAACLCIALLAVFGFYKPQSLANGTAGPSLTGTEQSNVADIKYGSGKGCGDVFMVNETGWCYLEITAWGDEEFFARVIGKEQEGGTLSVGEEISVKFESFVWIIKNTEESPQRVFGRIPTEEDFPVKSKVKAKLYGTKTEDGEYNLRTNFIGEFAPWEDFD